MKEFFITALFILLFVGVPTLLVCLPFVLRDAARKRDRKRRHRNLEGLRDVLGVNVKDFEITVRLNKEELKEVVKLEDRERHPIVFSIIASFVLLGWVIGGSIGIRDMITGEEPATVWRWIYNLFGVFAGGLIFFGIWFGVIMSRKRIDGASEYEVSQATERKYFIDAEGLRLSIDGEELEAVGWDGVDHVTEEADALQIMLVTGEFLWIPKDALFHQGDWEGLKAMLQPLKKGKHDV